MWQFEPNNVKVVLFTCKVLLLENTQHLGQQYAVRIIVVVTMLVVPGDASDNQFSDASFY